MYNNNNKQLEIMKAIIANVKKSSGYSNYNGLTFEINDYMRGLVGLKIPSKLDIEKLDTIDFSWDEIFIVDVQLEIKFCEAQIKILEAQIKILEGAEEWAKESDRYQNQINYLKKYCDYKKIKL